MHFTHTLSGAVVFKSAWNLAMVLASKLHLNWCLYLTAIPRESHSRLCALCDSKWWWQARVCFLLWISIKMTDRWPWCCWSARYKHLLKDLHWESSTYDFRCYWFSIVMSCWCHKLKEKVRIYICMYNIFSLILPFEFSTWDKCLVAYQVLNKTVSVVFSYNVIQVRYREKH